MRASFSQLIKQLVNRLGHHAGKLAALAVIACFVWLFGEQVKPEYRSSGIARVVDGDTLVINQQRLRLVGIDGPELSQQCRTAAHQSYACGQQSKQALAAKISQNPLHCEAETQDRHQRWLATCFLDSLNINSWLVRNGHALAYRRYSTAYVKEEEHAEAEQLGLWQGKFEPPWAYRRKR